MLASEAVSVRKPRSAADTAMSSTSVFEAERVKVGRARSSAADSRTPQLAASNALRRASVSANVPTVIVFHTGTETADLIRIGGILADGVFLSIREFCRTSRAE